MAIVFPARAPRRAARPPRRSPALPLAARLLRSLGGYGGRVAASLGLRGLGMGLQFAISVLAARLLGVEGFGVYTYAFVWVAVLGLVAQLGFGSLAAREMPDRAAAGDASGARRYLRFAGAATALAVGGIAAALAGAEAAGAAVPFGWALLALGVALQAGGALVAGALAGLQRIVASQMVEVTLRPLIMFAGLAALAAAPGAAAAGVDARDVYLLAVGATGASLAVAIVLLVRAMGRDLPGDGAPPPAPNPVPRAEARAWALGALALLATAITTVMMTNLDILMIGAMAPPDEVGRYRAASRGVDVILIATGVAIQVMGPMLARALAGEDRGAARGLITRAAATMMAAGLPLCAAFFVLAETYLGLFGPEFVPAAAAMRILVASQAIAILCGPAGMALIMMKRERLALWLNLAALAVNLGLNLLLIPIYGLEGAAVATLVSVAGVRIAMAVALLRAGHDPTAAAPVRAAWRRLRRGR